MRRTRRNHYGLSPTQRGYDYAYQKRRAKLLGLPCALRLNGCTGISTTAQHNDDGTLSPACAHCNYADGARRANRGERRDAMHRKVIIRKPATRLSNPLRVDEHARFFTEGSPTR